MKCKPLVFAGVLAAFGAAPAWAHHSFAMFDGSKKLQIDGTVKDFQWSNPHVWIQMIVADKDGKLVEWSIEAPAINGLQRVGWTSKSLKSGDKITAYIHPLRSGGPGGSLSEVVFPDGRHLGETQIQKLRDQSNK